MPGGVRGRKIEQEENYSIFLLLDWGNLQVVMSRPEQIRYPISFSWPTTSVIVAFASPNNIRQLG